MLLITSSSDGGFILNGSRGIIETISENFCISCRTVLFLRSARSSSHEYRMIFFGVSVEATAFVAAMSECESLNCGANLRLTLCTCQDSSSIAAAGLAGAVSMLGERLPTVGASEVEKLLERRMKLQSRKPAESSSSSTVAEAAESRQI